MKIHQTPISDLVIFEPKVFEDDRGYFFENFRKSVFEETGIDETFVQENESRSKKNTVRGLHFQAPPFAQAKLLRVVVGRIYDVVLDLRKSSKTYGQTFGIELSGENKKMLFVPVGFAHGFACLEDDTIVQYKCSGYYNKESEGGILWNDPELDINWSVSEPIISEKDHHHPQLKNFNSPFS